MIETTFSANFAEKIAKSPASMSTSTESCETVGVRPRFIENARPLGPGRAREIRPAKGGRAGPRSLQADTAEVLALLRVPAVPLGPASLGDRRTVRLLAPLVTLA